MEAASLPALCLSPTTAGQQVNIRVYSRLTRHWRRMGVEPMSAPGQGLIRKTLIVGICGGFGLNANNKVMYLDEF